MSLMTRVAMLLILNSVLGMGLLGVLCEEKNNYRPVAVFSAMATLLIVMANPVV